MWFKRHTKDVAREDWFDRITREREEAYKKVQASWAAPGSRYRDFEDCDVVEIDSKRSYLARCYRDSEELFYTAIEEGKVPTNSHAYYRFYDVVKHMGMLMPRILEALRVSKK